MCLTIGSLNKKLNYPSRTTDKDIVTAPSKHCSGAIRQLLQIKSNLGKVIFFRFIVEDACHCA